MMKVLRAWVVLIAAAPVWAQEKVDVKKAAAPDGRVSIENMAGSTRVIGWNREEVAVTGTLGRGAEGLDVSGGPGRTKIEVDVQGNPHSVRSDLEIHVPAGSHVEIDTFSADVTVSEVTGTVQVESVSGRLSISGGLKEASAQSVNGSIEITGPSLRTHAESVNGPVTVRGASGEVEASTVNGTLEVTGGSFEHCRMESVSGGVRFEGDLAGNAELNVETVSGPVDLLLPAKVAAEFSVSTFSGDVRNEFGAEPERKSRHASEKELTFSTGSGSARVSVQTLSGAITLRKR